MKTNSARTQSQQSLGISTRSVHGGERHHHSEGALASPIYGASTFAFDCTDDLIEFVEGRSDRVEYARYGNPNERIVEDKLASLEGAEDAILYSSGMAAVVGVLLSRLSSGDEVIFFDECYHRSREFCADHLSRYGIATREIRTGDFAAMEAAITPDTKMLVSESPTNPHLTCIDLEKFAAVGKAHGVETLIDATLATPYNVRPIEYGVDYVLHSATKYFGGHNDLLAGVICGSHELLKPVRDFRGYLGSVCSPHSLYLLERGLKTFALRMARHNENGMAVATFLHNHPRIGRVYYPGIESHPTHAIAAKQMNGFGGLMTFTIRGADGKATSKVVDAVTIPRIAASLGGVESLIEQPLVMSYLHYTPEQRQAVGIEDNMIRLSCGIEDSADLIADLDQALGR